MSKINLSIRTESDISEAVRQSRAMAGRLGFSTTSAYYIATAASELAANLWIHAGGGVITLQRLDGKGGMELTTIDHGPGIADIDRALEDGFSTANGLGCGLPGVKRLMDELDIASFPGVRTEIKARKWL